MLKSKKIIILFLITVFFITTGQRCGENLPDNQKYGPPDPVTLHYWKVFEDSDNINELISLYKKIQPHVTIRYKKLTYDEYENLLLKGLALYDQEEEKERLGPDIFSIHTTWMREYEDLIAPMPETVTVPYTFQKGSIQPETYTEFRQEKTPTLKEIRDRFPDVVYNNQIIDNQVYGLPLSIDTLGMFVNPKILNNVNITKPAENWVEFQEHVTKISRIDTENNQILLSGASIGTANNISRSADLLTLLMYQNNTPMTAADGTPTFDQTPQGYSRDQSPAAQALNFYTSFADPLSPVYTWNNQMENDIEAFIAGKTAYYFGYSFNIPEIKTLGPKLIFETAKVPQLSDTNYNIANYWAETVYAQSEHIDEAWNFIIFMTTNAEANKIYLDGSRKPPALLELLETQQNDLELAPFAAQVLTAKSWYKGKDADTANQIFKTMIEQNLKGEMETDEIIRFGKSQVNQTY